MRSDVCTKYVFLFYVCVCGGGLLFFCSCPYRKRFIVLFETLSFFCLFVDVGARLIGVLLVLFCMGKIVFVCFVCCILFFLRARLTPRLLSHYCVFQGGRLRYGFGEPQSNYGTDGPFAQRGPPQDSFWIRSDCTVEVLLGDANGSSTCYPTPHSATPPPHATLACRGDLRPVCVTPGCISNRGKAVKPLCLLPRTPPSFFCCR